MPDVFNLRNGLEQRGKKVCKRRFIPRPYTHEQNNLNPLDEEMWKAWKIIIIPKGIIVVIFEHMEIVIAQLEHVAINDSPN